MTDHDRIRHARQYLTAVRDGVIESGNESETLAFYDTALQALNCLATLERISDGGWVSLRRHLDAWLLESSRYHGRGATIREAIDHVELRPQITEMDVS